MAAIILMYTVAPQISTLQTVVTLLISYGSILANPSGANLDVVTG